jgi:hypothetical protein
MKKSSNPRNLSLHDIDLESFFSSTYSNTCTNPSRHLTVGDNRSVSTYLKFVSDQIISNKMMDRVQDLMDSATSNPLSFSPTKVKLLNSLNIQLTESMLAGEWLCAPNNAKLLVPFHTGKKSAMYNTKLFQWDHLEQLQHHTITSDFDHSNTDPK